MKQIFNSVLSVFILAVLAFSCKKDNSDPQVISGNLVNYSECKSRKSSDMISDTPDSVSCVEFTFNPSDSTLYLKHINAGFNCCPKGLYCNISISNDTITIQEFENAHDCRCNCLYDLEIEINGATIKKYQLKFIEPYSGEQEKLFFEIDLTNKNAGSYCVSRNQYPWGN